MKQSTNYAVFWTLFHNLPYEGDKQELKEYLVDRVTSGRTTSLRDTTRAEYKELCDHLAKMLAEIPMRKHRIALSRKRSEALRLMTTYGVDTQDWAKINRFCEDARIAGKPFAKLHFDDLATLSRKLRAMIGKKTTAKN